MYDLLNQFKNIVLLVVCGVTFLMLGACSEPKKHRVADDAVLASVGDVSILSKDFVDKLLSRSNGVRELSLAQKQSVLDEMIQRQLQITAAREAGFASDPAILKALENLMINKLRSEQLDTLLAQVSVSPVAIEQYYQQNIHRYTSPSMTRLAIIRLTLSPQASADKRAAVKAQAEQVYKLALTQPDSLNGFGSLAAKHSDHQASRYAGGDFGWIKNQTENRTLDTAVAKALEQLNENGDLAPLVEGADGYYLIKLLDRKPETQKSLDIVASNIQRILEYESRKLAEAQWFETLQSKGQALVINQNILAAITLPESSSEPLKKAAPPLLPSK